VLRTLSKRRLRRPGKPSKAPTLLLGKRNRKRGRSWIKNSNFNSVSEGGLQTMELAQTAILVLQPAEALLAV
jgi:hypothetical protein